MITREQIIWIYKTLLNRDPEDESVVAEHMRVHEDSVSLILAVVKSPEYRQQTGHGA